MSTVLITGGTGLIGKELVDLLLKNGFNIKVASRNTAKMGVGKTGITYTQWDIKNQTVADGFLDGVDYIVHLAGAGVAEKRWTEERKKEIVDSRVLGGQLLSKTLSTTKHHVKAVIAASAIGWYGEDVPMGLDNAFEENSLPDKGFLGETCRLWEESMAPIAQMGIRLVLLRTGIVLSKNGGALPEFIKPIQFGLCTILGSGEQIISWIGIDDICKMYLFAIQQDSLEGVYNAVAPNPVSNKELAVTLAKQMRGRWFLPMYVPSWLLKIIMGEMSVEVLKSARVSSGKIEKAGFVFGEAFIEGCLRSVVR